MHLWGFRKYLKTGMWDFRWQERQVWGTRTHWNLNKMKGQGTGSNMFAITGFFTVNRGYFPCNLLVHTKWVDTVFRMLWLATETLEIQCYSLIHLQALSNEQCQTHILYEQNVFLVCYNYKTKNNLLPLLFGHNFKLTIFQVLYVTVI